MIAKENAALSERDDVMCGYVCVFVAAMGNVIRFDDFVSIVNIYFFVCVCVFKERESAFESLCDYNEQMEMDSYCDLPPNMGGSVFRAKTTTTTTPHTIRGGEQSVCVYARRREEDRALASVGY